MLLSFNPHLFCRHLLPYSHIEALPPVFTFVKMSVYCYWADMWGGGADVGGQQGGSVKSIPTCREKGEYG